MKEDKITAKVPVPESLANVPPDVIESIIHKEFAKQVKKHMQGEAERILKGEVFTDKATKKDGEIVRWGIGEIENVTPDKKDI